MIILYHNPIFSYTILMRFRPVSHRGTNVITLHNSASKEGMQSPYPGIVNQQHLSSPSPLVQCYIWEHLGAQPSCRGLAWAAEPWYCTLAQGWAPSFLRSRKYHMKGKGACSFWVGSYLAGMADGTCVAAVQPCSLLQPVKSCWKVTWLQPEDSSSKKESQPEKGDGGRIVLYLKDTVSQ